MSVDSGRKLAVPLAAAGPAAAPPDIRAEGAEEEASSTPRGRRPGQRTQVVQLSPQAKKGSSTTGARVLAGAKLGASGRAAAILLEQQKRENDLGNGKQTSKSDAADTVMADSTAELAPLNEKRARSPTMTDDGLKLIKVPGRGAVVKQTRAAKMHAEKEDKSGLRTVAQQLIERMEKYGRRSFQDVQNELVTDLETPKLDGTNIRKRVYDAVNVLTAMEILRKDGKDIIWCGMPTLPHSGEHAQLLQETRQLRESIAAAEHKLADLNSRTSQYRAIIERNAERRGRVAPAEMIKLPFVVVRAPKESQIMCEFVDDHTLYSFDFNQPFEMQDDAEILKRMNLASNAVTDQTVPGVEAPASASASESTAPAAVLATDDAGAGQLHVSSQAGTSAVSVASAPASNDVELT